MAKTSFYSGSGTDSTEVPAGTPVPPNHVTALDAIKAEAEAAQAAAETSETNAASSAAAAASSASTATTQASTATTQATNAASSATTATTQASTATTQATNAAASASTASTHASTATTKATEAATSATSSETAKTASETAKTAAETAETNAAASATAAAASAASINSYTGGTGITVSGTTITNDSPDQTVALTAGSNVSVSGTYPNFTISSTDTNTTYSVGDNGLTEKNFTTTLKNKLDAIEASADVTDTTNVTAAGALMDSEVTNLAQVKAFDSSDYATAAQGSTADAAMPKAGGTFSGDVTIEDNEKLHFGDGQDLSIHHYSDNWIVSNNGDLHIRQEATDKDVKIQADNANGHAVDYFQADGSTGEVILSHFGYPKIKTKSTGADITGDITVSGTVDGVDIAARDAVLTSTTTTANAAMPKAGGTFTGDISFEGATANDYETTVTVTDPTADQTITLPNQTGTAMLWQSVWPDDPNSTGYNTVLGGTAGRDLDATASHNTLIGQNAGLSIVSQDYNTAIGQYAYGDDSTASSGHNTAVGHYALTYNNWWLAAGMQYNTSVGSYSGSTNKSGDQNTFVGYQAKNYYNNSSNSVIVGYDARAGHSGNVTIGSTAAKYMVNQCDRNTIVGYAAAQALNGSDDNVYIGDRSGYRTTTGAHNTMVGGLTGFYNTLGAHNTYIGERAGFNGYNGDNNTFVGKYAGYDVEGDNNTVLGYYAGFSGNMDTNANCLVLGANANPSTNSVSNEITLGDANISSLRCNVQTISSLSDKRDKTAIKDLTYGLDFINDMRPVEFTWNRRDGSLGAKTDIGFIAQELWETELDHSSSSRTRLVNWENPQKLEADYVRSYPILVKAVQELSAQVTALEARIKTLEGN